MIFWATVRFHVTGRVVTYRATSAFKRALVIIATRLDADVIDQGETASHA